MNTEIFSLEETLDLNQKLLLNLNKKLEYMKDDYARVVYLAYKNRNFLDKITFIFSAESFSQMFRRARYYNLFSANIKQQVELIEQTCEEINKKNEQILQLKDEKTVLLNEKEREIKALERDRNKKSRMTEELKKKERQLAADLKTKQAKRKELDVAIKKAVEEEIRAENAKKKKSSTTATTSSGEDKTWPTLSVTTKGTPAAAHSRAAINAPLGSVSYTHLRAHETPEQLVCRLLLEKKNSYASSYRQNHTPYN